MQLLIKILCCFEKKGIPLHTIRAIPFQLINRFNQTEPERMDYNVAIHNSGQDRPLLAHFAVCNVTSAKMLHFQKCLFHTAKRMC